MFADMQHQDQTVHGKGQSFLNGCSKTQLSKHLGRTQWIYFKIVSDSEDLLEKEPHKTASVLVNWHGSVRVPIGKKPVLNPA